MAGIFKRSAVNVNFSIYYMMMNVSNIYLDDILNI
jgi:hypothetical protein